LYLASGTDEIYMQEEARLLDVARYFDGGVYGAIEDYKSFSKRILVQRTLRLPEVRGAHLLGFGDGYVEIEEVKQVGGVTVGVATDEPELPGGQPVEAPATDRRRRRLHHPQLPRSGGAYDDALQFPARPRLAPVLPFKSLDARKFRGISRYQREFTPQCLASNQQVVGPDWLPLFFQRRSYHARGLSVFILERQRGDWAGEERLEPLPVNLLA